MGIMQLLETIDSVLTEAVSPTLRNEFSELCCVVGVDYLVLNVGFVQF